LLMAGHLVLGLSLTWPLRTGASNALSLSKGFRFDVCQRRGVELLPGKPELAETVHDCFRNPIGPSLMPSMPDLHPPIVCPGPCPGLFWVYILQPADATYYVGQTCDLRERLRKHRLGIGSKHTNDHGNPHLVYAEALNDLTAAVRRERQLKGWSRAKKAALIHGDFDQLRKLSQSHDQI
jgi:putative endonuclease